MSNKKDLTTMPKVKNEMGALPPSHSQHKKHKEVKL